MVDVALENLVANFAVALVAERTFAVACARPREFAFCVNRAAVRTGLADVDGHTSAAIARKPEVARAVVRARTSHVAVRIHTAQTILNRAAIQWVAEHAIAGVARFALACESA